MRYLIALVIPFAVQILAFVGVFAAARGGGSFMGLVAMPVAACMVPVLLITGVNGARGTKPLGNVALTTLALAVVPPILLLVFRALE